MRVQEFLVQIPNVAVSGPISRCLGAGGRGLELNEPAACEVELYGFAVKFRGPEHKSFPDTFSVRRLPDHRRPRPQDTTAAVRMRCEPDGTFSIEVAGSPVERFRAMKLKCPADDVISHIDAVGLVRKWHVKSKLPRYSMRELFGVLVGASDDVMLGTMAADYAVG